MSRAPAAAWRQGARIGSPTRPEWVQSRLERARLRETSRLASCAWLLGPVAGGRVTKPFARSYARASGVRLRERPAVFPHEPWHGYFGRRDVVRLWDNAGRRELGLEGFDEVWSTHYRIAFRQPVIE